MRLLLSPTVQSCRPLLWLWLCLLVILTSLWTRPVTAAEEMPRLSISVLQFGTAHWELDHLQRAGLDRAEGFELEVRLVANLPASRLAVSSGDVEGAVADLLWAQARYEAGDPFTYLPFSSQIGDILVAPESGIRQVSDLVGQRIGVAGGPDSKGWILLEQVARRQGIDLASQASVQYAAPPLLSQALVRDQVDVLVTYWHFAARLRADGDARTAFRMEDLLAALDFDPNLPVLGYVFRADWAQAHPDLLARFHRALNTAKTQLASSPEHWQALRPLMRADDDAIFAQLRDGFIEGTPAPLTPERIEDLQRLLALAGTDEGRVMPSALFYRPGP